MRVRGTGARQPANTAGGVPGLAPGPCSRLRPAAARSSLQAPRAAAGFGLPVMPGSRERSSGGIALVSSMMAGGLRSPRLALDDARVFTHASLFGNHHAGFIVCMSRKKKKKNKKNKKKKEQLLQEKESPKRMVISLCH